MATNTTKSTQLTNLQFVRLKKHYFLAKAWLIEKLVQKKSQPIAGHKYILLESQGSKY